MPKKIPDRWTDYSAVGKRIPGTRFIAFKVPLKQSLSNCLSQSSAFGPFDLLHVLEKQGQELGLIIDLTFTTRYYKPQDLPDTFNYLKIFTAGHEVPSDSTILSFKKAVRRFLRENENNDKLIGVHCTHGLNRTGYLVCRYLIDVDGVDPHEAIDLFNTSRGHTIERQNYLDDLRSGPKRSNEGMEEPDQEPVQGGGSYGAGRPGPPQNPHSFNRRGSHYQHHHYQQQQWQHYHNPVVPFQPRSNQGFRRSLMPHPPDPWQGSNPRFGPRYAQPPYPGYAPHYAFGEQWGDESYSLPGPEEPQRYHRNPRPRHGKTRRGRTR
ncbi:RNA/RNP complex-1-interacting phosphatase [Hoplias malabaricus]|uniref:RNA/RNP complex-1-interacting phosphatase n=1 Tax=Hoplias malabaricus TaxID=27720 RepID=UPI00346250F9